MKQGLAQDKTQMECQTYENYYGNRKLLNGFESYVVWMKNKYHPTQNPQGIINFSTSVNSIIPKKTIQYLPSFISQEDCSYPDPRGFDEQLGNKIVKGTQFKWDQTFVFNKNACIISLLGFHYKKVYILDDSASFNVDPILDHARAVKVDNISQSDLIVIISASQDKMKEIQKLYDSKVKLYILKSRQALKVADKAKEKQVFAYDMEFKENLTLCVVHTIDETILQYINIDWTFFHPSNITKKAALREDAQIKIGNSNTEVIRKMIKIDSNVQVSQKNIWITPGAGGGINALSRVLFNGGNLFMDSPYYIGFDFDFTHSGVKILHKSMLSSNKIIGRIKQAYQEGAVGYVVCNPNNPIGNKLSPEDVIQICQWALDKPKFHLIFDQMYPNTCRVGSTMSAASYAIKFPNIHVIRGMAKDFGICGFKIGFVISSNCEVVQKFNSWKDIISHHPFSISVVNQMLLKSNYGQDIISYGKQILRQYFEEILGYFDEAKIKYIRPEAGCFVFIDLRDFLRSKSYDEENVLWKKFFYKYRVNVNCGANFHAIQPGYYRVCPIADKQILREGFKRLKAALLDKDE